MESYCKLFVVGCYFSGVKRVCDDKCPESIVGFSGSLSQKYTFSRSFRFGFDHQLWKIPTVIRHGARLVKTLHLIDKITKPVWIKHMGYNFAGGFCEYVLKKHSEKYTFFRL